MLWNAEEEKPLCPILCRLSPNFIVVHWATVQHTPLPAWCNCEPWSVLLQSISFTSASPPVLFSLWISRKSEAWKILENVHVRASEHYLTANVFISFPEGRFWKVGVHGRVNTTVFNGMELLSRFLSVLGASSCPPPPREVGLGSHISIHNRITSQ